MTMNCSAKRLAVCSTLGLFWLGFAAPVTAQYHIVPVGPGFTDPRALSYDINLLGDLAGSVFYSSNGDYHAFRRTSGDPVDLGTLGGTLSYGTGINNASEVVGYSQTTRLDANLEPIYRAFLFSGGVLQDLGTIDIAGVIYGASSY